MPKLFVEAEKLTPKVLIKKDLEEIGNLPVYEGPKIRKLSDFFKIEGNSSENIDNLKLILNGDLWKFKRICEGLSGGHVVINGNCGMHLATNMRGGKIEVYGRVDSWAFTQISGGNVLIEGSCGNYFAAGTRGNWRGMQGGKIIVKGNLGNEACAWMNNGYVEVHGNVGDFLGIHMKNGCIYVKGNIGKRVGSFMKNGCIVLEKCEDIPPWFKYKDIVENPNNLGLKGKYKQFVGDITEKGKGTLLIKVVE
jgi:formylmethanofuran dehydrogenase subunit C